MDGIGKENQHLFCQKPQTLPAGIVGIKAIVAMAVYIYKTRHDPQIAIIRVRRFCAIGRNPYSFAAAK